MRKLWPVMLGMVLLMMAVLAGCGGNEQHAEEPVELTISAAASLQDAMKELEEIYVDQNPAVKITYNFAASGPLQRQIEEGASVDLFISAGKSQMDALAEKGLIVEDTRQNLLGNELVLITQENRDFGWSSLTGPEIEKISIGTPETSPVGKYAKQSFISMELWDEIQSKLVLAKDVRQVLTYVETGNVDAGLVYRSDALMGKGIRVAETVPAEAHEPIVYPMAVIKSSQAQEETKAFVDFLTGEQASAIFQQYGFIKPSK